MISILERYFLLWRLSELGALKRISDVDPTYVLEVLNHLSNSGMLQNLQDRVKRGSPRAKKKLQEIHTNVTNLYTVCRSETNGNAALHYRWKEIMDLCQETCRTRARINTGDFKRRMVV